MAAGAAIMTALQRKTPAEYEPAGAKTKTAWHKAVAKDYAPPLISTSTAAHKAFAELRSRAGFDERDFLSWDANSFLEVHGITQHELTTIMAATRPRTNADRFEWLEAVNQRHDLGVRTLRVAVALFSFVGRHGYAWPSQRAIAQRAGYQAQDERNIRRGIKALEEIKAIRILRAANLPAELAALALGSPREGGSGRTFRGSAYALVPAGEWQSQGHGGPITRGLR